MDYSHENPLVAPADVKHWLEAIPGPIAITGGTGFVGSHLVDCLCAAGIRPRVLVRRPDDPRWIADAPVEMIEGSLEDIDALGRLVDGAGSVFHIAGVLRAASEKDFDEGNRQGTQNLVRAVGRNAASARLIHVSSLAAVGPSPEPEGVGPEAEAAPVSWYGKSKLAAEGEIRAGAGDGWWTIIRPPAIYGPRDSDIFEFFRMADRGVVAFPGGERWLTVSYVGDVVRAILAAAAGNAGAVFHIGEPEPVRLDDMISILSEAGGVRSKVVKLPPWLVAGAGSIGSLLQRLGWRRLPLTQDKCRDLLASHWTARTADSLQALGIASQTLFAPGCRETWQWYREQGWLAR